MKRIKHWLTNEGPTSAAYQRKADRVTNVMGWVGWMVAAIGVVVILYIIHHPFTCVSKPIEGIANFK